VPRGKADSTRLSTRDRAGRYRRHLWSTYRLTPEQVGRVLIHQRHRCPLCGRKVKLKVDHDHDTGRFRGLACNRCNPLIERVEAYLASPPALAAGVDHVVPVDRRAALTRAVDRARALRAGAVARRRRGVPGERTTYTSGDVVEVTLGELDRRHGDR